MSFTKREMDLMVKIQELQLKLEQANETIARKNDQITKIRQNWLRTIRERDKI